MQGRPYLVWPAGQGLAFDAEAYLEFLQVHNYSKATICSSRESLLQFAAWCQEREVVGSGEVTRAILEAFQRWLSRYRKPDGRALGIDTQRNRLNRVKLFFQWLCRQRLLEANPASELELPRKERRLPQEPLTAGQVEQVLALPNVGDPVGVRDRAILEVLYSTGIRRTELTRLALGDVNLERATLQIRQGKGKKDRVVPVGGLALLWLEKYMSQARDKLVIEAGEDALFLSVYGLSLTPVVLGKIVHNYVEQAGLKRAGSCHLFRHSCATHMLENGADIRFIQQLLGHARLDTTQIYTEVSILQLQKVHARTHPRGERKVDSRQKTVDR